MTNPFRLKGPFGADYAVDGDDIERTKRALHQLGHFEDKTRINRFADQPMIDGLIRFQREHGLDTDGVMKPGGPTARELGKALSENDAPTQPRWSAAATMRRLPKIGIPERPEAPSLRPATPEMAKHARPVLFDVGAGVGRDRANAPRDVLAARRALAWSGDLNPASGLDELRPGDDLFGAIERFQARHGLTRDGWMGQGGETAKALNAEIAPKVSGRQKPGIKEQPQLAMAPKPRLGVNSGPEGAPLSNAFFRGHGPALLGAAAAAQEIIRQGTKGLPGSEEVAPAPAPGQGRTDIHAPPPPIPPSEPDDDREPTTTETPARPPIQEMDLSNPIPEKAEPGIFVHPVPPEDLTNGMIIERKGNEATRKELERIRDHYEKLGWDHIGGGRFSAKNKLIGTINPKTRKVIKVGDEQEETHIPGHGVAWGADSRPGGRFVDLTFKTPGGRIVHIQSVDIDKHGKTKAHELDAAESIRRAEPKSHVYLFPKGAQLKRRKKRSNR